ncbi:MAG: hypothetical protein HY327_11200 [Chloroflexi bacterium]|nr:hypothetical protein [Chloroflexota bacterium]
MKNSFFVPALIGLAACAAPSPTPTPVPTIALPTVTPTAIPTSTLAPTLVPPTETPAPIFTPTSAATLNAKRTIFIDSTWAVFNPGVVEMEIKGKSLTLSLNKPALWFNNLQGVLAYKLISGNFKATAGVSARKRSNPAQPPSIAVHLGGIMARNPIGVGSGGAENYVFVVVGFDVDDLSVETKTTINNISQFEGPAWGTGDAELRMCRIANAFHLFKRRIGATAWTLATTYNRADLPATLQVGANIYSLNNPDLRVTFENLRIESVIDRTDCERD